jgi:hypothetical protein
MTFYRHIRPMQPPHDIGLDQGVGKPQVVFNIECTKNRSTTFFEEIVSILEDAGVGTFNVNIFATSNAVLPEERESVYLKLRETGGIRDEEIHNEVGKYRRPTMSITAVGPDYEAARTLAEAAHAALRVVRNQEVTP